LPLVVHSTYVHLSYRVVYCANRDLFKLYLFDLVSLELLKQDVKQMQKGFSVAASELVHDKTNAKLKVCVHMLYMQCTEHAFTVHEKKNYI